MGSSTFQPPHDQQSTPHKNNHTRKPQAQRPSILPDVNSDIALVTTAKYLSQICDDGESGKKRLKIFALGYRFVCLIDHGASVNEAINRLNPTLSQSAAHTGNASG